jgi:hypothetical protein
MTHLRPRGGVSSASLKCMSIVELVHATLKQEGYQPKIGEGGTLSFRYFGQDASFRARPVGPVTIGELQCALPRPVPSAEQVQLFSSGHPLARLAAREGQLSLTIETMIGGPEAGGQFRALLQLLDQYAASAVFGVVGTGAQSPARLEQEGVAVPEPTPVTVPTPPAPDPAPVSPADSSTGARSSASPGIPEGWDEVWALMNTRYHPLARALAALGVPAPGEVHMDMLQGHQVRGTALMMWGAPPQAVVVCEPGQMVPQGYQGSTWLRHLTVEQVAQETQAHLRAAGRL